MNLYLDKLTYDQKGLTLEELENSMQNIGEIP
jgi:hypothetical protein